MPFQSEAYKDRVIDRIADGFEVDFETGCFNWIKSLSTSGYPIIAIRGTTKTGTRIVYDLFVDTIPDGLCVCHICDNRTCINPDHLFLGTIADNNRDRADKGRSSKIRKTMPNLRRFTDDDIKGIREDYASGDYSMSDLANECNTSTGVIWHIIHRKTYSDVE